MVCMCCVCDDNCAYMYACVNIPLPLCMAVWATTRPCARLLISTLTKHIHEHTLLVNFHALHPYVIPHRGLVLVHEHALLKLRRRVHQYTGSAHTMASPTHPANQSLLTRTSNDVLPTPPMPRRTHFTSKRASTARLAHRAGASSHGSDTASGHAGRCAPLLADWPMPWPRPE